MAPPIDPNAGSPRHGRLLAHEYSAWLHYLGQLWQDVLNDSEGRRKYRRGPALPAHKRRRIQRTVTRLVQLRSDLIPNAKHQTVRPQT